MNSLPKYGYVSPIRKRPESMKNILEEAPPGALQVLIDTIKKTPIQLHISTNRAVAIASTILERFEMPTLKKSMKT